jgi:hypothetical protein
VLVDTAQRGEPPGTVYIIEPEASAIADPQPEDLLLSPHELDPATVLRLALALGSDCRRVILVACEPASFGDEELGAMELTPPVAAAVDPAADLVEQVIRKLLAEENPPWTAAIHPQSGRTIEPYRDGPRNEGMSGWSIFGITMGVLVAAAVAYNMPDLIRYIRIRNM